jgi:hypothetical protein
VNYLDQLADRIQSEVPHELLPEGDTTDLFRLYAVLALALGTRVQLSDVHNAWVAWMLRLGPGHPALVPFQELEPGQQMQDAPFADAIRRVSAQLNVD